MTIKTMTMPQLGESVTEGTISQWLTGVGDSIEKYQPLLEVMTDKVNAEVPSLFEGELIEMLVEEEETVEVGTPICKIKVSNSESQSSINQASNPVEESAQSAESEASHSMKKRYSPAVLTLARKHDIDLDKIRSEDTRLNSSHVANSYA